MAEAKPALRPSGTAADAVRPTQTPQPSAGFTIAARITYGFTFGKFANDTAPDDVLRSFSALVPLQLDAGWRFANGITAGAYFQYARAQVYGRCPSGADCSGHDLRYGVQGLWSPAWSMKGWGPWAGLGVGLDSAHIGLVQKGIETAASYSGWDATLQGGIEHPLGRGFAVGPTLALVGGMYRHLDASVGSGSGSEELRYRTGHVMLMLGMRVRLGGLL